MQLHDLLDVPWLFRFTRDEIRFTEFQARLEVTRDRLLRDLLPGDIDAEGLKVMGIGLLLS